MQKVWSDIRSDTVAINRDSQGLRMHGSNGEDELAAVSVHRMKGLNYIECTRRTDMDIVINNS